MNDLRKRFPATPRLLVVGLIVFGAACHHAQPAAKPAPAPPRQTAPNPTAITSGPTLIQAMHERHSANWYRTLTFKQKTTLGLPSGGEIVQTWYEAAHLPGRLRIDTDLRSKSGTLFARDTIYSFNGGKLVRADSGLNELLVLGFDVYTQAPARTQAQLRRMGFDLSRFHESTWQGTPVYVVGAARGDSTSKQFWVDRERLLFVRMIEQTAQGRSDTRFNDYAQHGGGWVAAEVVQNVNGKRRILEQYSEIHTGVTLSDGLFDPRQWSTAPHWVSPQER
jgi:hypothetical protein